jgi:transposase
MSDDALFEGLSPAAPPPPETAPRLEMANRTQIELRPCDLESLLPPGHAARLVWHFVEGLNLEPFYTAIRAREGSAGRPAIDPRILIGLWLYATIDGVGSAREVDRLSDAHDAYRWLRGGVSVNYHTLSDFRVTHGAALDALLTQSITVLLHRGVVTMARVAQDGTRVRASAGVGSFRRAATLAECQTQARKQVERTARQADAPVSRPEAAQARAARERLARVEEALAELPAVAAAKTRNRAKGEARVSTTDPAARMMKMADGGFRPAYNVQFATDGDSHVIVGVAVTNVGNDQQQLIPMLTQIERRCGRPPTGMLADGGYVSYPAIDATAAREVTLLMPEPAPPSGRPRGTAYPTDSPAVAAWRARMVTDEAKTQYRQRGAIAERVHADARTHRTLRQVSVRGLSKVHCWVLWVALAHNMMRAMGIVPHLMM